MVTTPTEDINLLFWLNSDGCASFSIIFIAIELYHCSMGYANKNLDQPISKLISVIGG